VALDEPRFLDRRPHRSYTSNPALAMRNEPEAISEEAQERYSSEARRRFEQSRAVELALRGAKTRSARLRNLQSELLRLDVDGRRELGAIDAQLDLIARKVAQRRTAPSTAP